MLGNNIRVGGAVAVAMSLKHNHTLTALQIGSRNNIETEGAEAIARALMDNLALRILDIGDNGIGAEAAMALATLLQHNNTLTYLSLNGNDITDAGAAAIVNALQYNQSLTSLKLGVSCYHSLRRAVPRDDAGEAALVDVIRGNSTITTLQLGSHLRSWHSELQAVIMDVTAANETRVVLREKRWRRRRYFLNFLYGLQFLLLASAGGEYSVTHGDSHDTMSMAAVLYNRDLDRFICSFL
jgi:hypothetical protein